jgi:regulator of protease activity HflC (stomatin/prohibitin superfamily)
VTLKPRRKIVSAEGQGDSKIASAEGQGGSKIASAEGQGGSKIASAEGQGGSNIWGICAFFRSAFLDSGNVIVLAVL